MSHDRGVEARKPQSRTRVFSDVKAFIKARYPDPTVEVKDVGSAEMRIRVGQDSGGPRYFRIKVVEEK